MKVEALLHCPTSWALTAWGTALQKRTWGALVDTKLNLSQQCTLAKMMANHILGYITKCIGSRLKEVIIIFRSTLVKPNLEYCISPLCKRY